MISMIIFSSTTFKEEAKKELSDLFKECTFEDLFEGKFILMNKYSKKEALKKIKEKDPIFVHNAVPIDLYFKLSENLEHIAQQIASKLLEKEKSFAIECITYKSKIKSRDLEVRVGSILEKKGFMVDRDNFDQLIGIIINKNDMYIGSVDFDLLLYKYLDIAKRFSRESIRESRLNRAQFKIIEALERFNIKLNGKGKYALDLGASPGGWSKVLSSKGYKIIAIDKGELDNSLKDNPNIYHIKQRITKENASDIKALIDKVTNKEKLDIITNDINASPYKSIEIMNEFLEFLNKGGKVIITLKSVRRNILDLIKDSEEKLKENYDIIKIKHLEQNRREVTLYMNKK